MKDNLFFFFLHLYPLLTEKKETRNIISSDPFRDNFLFLKACVKQSQLYHVCLLLIQQPRGDIILQE